MRLAPIQFAKQQLGRACGPGGSCKPRPFPPLTTRDPLTSKRLIDTDPNTVHAFVAGWIETIDFILTHKADDVGRAFRLMSATCSDPCRPAVPHSIRSAYSGCRDQRLPFN